MFMWGTVRSGKVQCGAGCLQREAFFVDCFSVETPSGLLRRDADRLGRARCTEVGKAPVGRDKERCDEVRMGKG